MPASKIMLMRHAEKPSDDGTVLGVTQTGVADQDELSVRGWQRAGGLAHLFSVLGGAGPIGELAKPRALFAPAIAGPVKSKRSRHTILPLAKRLGLVTDTQYTKDDLAGLSQALLQAEGVVLACWEHKVIPQIANEILGNSTDVPQLWPDGRFDVIWVLDATSSGWSFNQLPQLVLGGDEEAAI